MEVITEALVEQINWINENHPECYYEQFPSYLILLQRYENTKGNEND